MRGLVVFGFHLIGETVFWLVYFNGVRVAQYLDFCVMVGRLLVGFVLLNI